MHKGYLGCRVQASQNRLNCEGLKLPWGEKKKKKKTAKRPFLVLKGQMCAWDQTLLRAYGPLGEPVIYCPRQIVNQLLSSKLLHVEERQSFMDQETRTHSGIANFCFQLSKCMRMRKRQVLKDKQLAETHCMGSVQDHAFTECKQLTNFCPLLSILTLSAEAAPLV